MLSKFIQLIKKNKENNDMMEHISINSSSSTQALLFQYKFYLILCPINLLAFVINFSSVINGTYVISWLTFFAAFNAMYSLYALIKIFSHDGRVIFKNMFSFFNEHKILNILKDEKTFKQIFNKLYSDPSNHTILKKITNDFSKKTITIDQAYLIYSLLTNEDENKNNLFNQYEQEITNPISIDNKENQISFFQKNS